MRNSYFVDFERKLIAFRAKAQYFLLLLSAAFLTESAALASHVKHTPLPAPTLPTTDFPPTVDVTSPSILSLLLFLLFIALAIWIYSLRRDLAFVEEEACKRIEALEAELVTEKDLSATAQKKANESSRNFLEADMALSRKSHDLKEALSELQHLREMLRAITSFDPEIERKAIALQHEKAKRAGEREEEQKVHSEKMRVQLEGKQQINDLLVAMKRGW